MLVSKYLVPDMRLMVDFMHAWSKPHYEHWFEWEARWRKGRLDGRTSRQANCTRYSYRLGFLSGETLEKPETQETQPGGGLEMQVVGYLGTSAFAAYLRRVRRAGQTISGFFAGSEMQ